jgi:NAD(P)-dependent dehydrogenase (short-subunit alcohol dehydrogenase family)
MISDSIVLLDIADCDETMAALAKYTNCKVEQVALAIRCDISKESEVIESLQKASTYFGPRFDILVNNACTFVFRSVEDATVEDWTKSMQVNILGHALVTKHCLPYMKHATDKPAGHGPSIIFQGSISSFRGQPGCATYATMKGAIVQLARNCAYDLAKYNIRVNSICPGTIGKLKIGWRLLA